MIRPSSIALAEAIAVAVNTDNVIEVKPLIAGLNSESHGSAMYQEDFRNEIVKVTTDITAHTPFLDLTSDRLAESLRNGLDMITTYGVPFAKAIAGEVGMLYTKSRLQQIVFGQLNYDFVNVDDPFFDSPIFPTEVKNSALGYEGVSLAVLRRLEFNYPTDEDILKYINSEHPDIVEIVNDTEYELGAAANMVFDEHSLTQNFVNRDMVFDFTKIKSMEINRLLKMYVIVSKMYASEEPAPWLAKGSLTDYREYVNLLWNGLTRYLISLKEIALAYKSRVVAMMDLKPVTVGVHPRADFDTARFLQGSVRIFYTNQALETVEKAGISFSEWLIACLWSRFNKADIAIVDLLSDAAAVNKWADEYYRSVNDALIVKARSAFVKSAALAGVRFMHIAPLLRDRVDELRDQNQMADDWFTNSLLGEYEKAYYQVAAVLNGDSSEVASEADGNPTLDALLAGSLVPAFLRIVKCDTAAAIIEHTYVTGEAKETPERQRERLHEALIKIIIDNSFIGR